MRSQLADYIKLPVKNHEQVSKYKVDWVQHVMT